MESPATQGLVTLCVVYCTGNAGKFREASHVFDEWNAQGTQLKVSYVQMDPDPVEVQGPAEKVAERKALEATRLLVENGGLDEYVSLCDHCDVVTEDVGLSLGCLNGFPGVYCKPMLEAIGDDGLWNLVQKYEDKKARVTCTLAAVSVEMNERTKRADIFNANACECIEIGAIEGTIGPPKGNVKHGATSWNSVFTPTGRSQTFGETPFEEQAQFSHRREAIMKYLDSRRETIIAVRKNLHATSTP
jgi:inosine triphosphate pyrophosphatase